MLPRRWSTATVPAILCLLAAGPLPAAVPPAGSSPVEAREIRHPGLSFRNTYVRPDELPPASAVPAPTRLAELGVEVEKARLDRRSGRWGTLLVARPLLPGDGVGNRLTWRQLGLDRAPSGAALERAAWKAFTDFLAAHQSALGIDPSELSGGHRVSVHDEGRLVQIHAPRTVGGVPVRGSYLSAVLSHGNLVLLGAHRWGDVGVEVAPSLSAAEAGAVAESYLAPLAPSGTWLKPHRVLVPLVRGQELDQVAVGQGYAHRLAWVFGPLFEGDDGRWEMLVDAHSGEVLSLADTRRYASARQVAGGVFPISNDGGAGGVEEAGWPMPFDEVVNGGQTLTADSGGNLLCAVGDITSSLAGQYVRIDDGCGAISLTSAGDLDFGTSGGTDCTTPGTGGDGNTHAARTSFYELGRIAEQARALLPSNAWVRGQLGADTNISAACQASWDGTEVNFYRSVGGVCANTGELAGVIDHEWGHGMDDNDANPSPSNPGEGIADLYAYLRLDTSCIGRGFRPGVNCGGYGDACVACDGVRDIDYANRVSGLPHDIAWIDANCGSGETTPCGGITHCEGAVYAEAVYDLIDDDLPGLFGMSHDTALALGTQLTYEGGGAVGTWFQCDTAAPIYGGCGADGGYLNFLAADDDNGDISDGTPHMSAIFAAFDRHGIACDTPAVVDSGCAGTPAAAPAVVAAARDRGAALSWGAVAGATSYRIYRTDGDAACAYGKTEVGETAGTSFVDTGLQNGRAYSWTVVPIGAADTCFGPASACAAASPSAGPNLAVDLDSQVFDNLSIGDGDPYFDNCELGRITFEVANSGTGALSNVRIVGVTSPSHPATLFVTGFPAATSPAALAECDTASASFDFIAGGLAFNDTLELLVEMTADELPGSIFATFSIEGTESDFSTVASATFDFEADLGGWQLIEGTFDRTDAGGGAELTPYYVASSSGLPNQCDHIRSPQLRLSASSTLELYNEYDIEDATACVPCTIFCPYCSPTWFDRANLGVYQVDDDNRVLITPDGGRPYNASGGFGSCGTAGQGGWAGTEIVWQPSTWSSTALGAAGFARPCSSICATAPTR